MLHPILVCILQSGHRWERKGSRKQQKGTENDRKTRKNWRSKTHISNMTNRMILLPSFFSVFTYSHVCFVFLLVCLCVCAQAMPEAIARDVLARYTTAAFPPTDNSSSSSPSLHFTARIPRDFFRTAENCVIFSLNQVFTLDQRPVFDSVFRTFLSDYRESGLVISPSFPPWQTEELPPPASSLTAGIPDPDSARNSQSVHA